MESINTKQRFYYLDWIRIIATWGVFLLHVAHIFDEVPFQIQNNETNMFFLIIVTNLNFWIMPLFFLIAGISTVSSLKKRTNKIYLKERVTRLIVPFCTGLFILALPQDYVEALNYKRFTGSFIEFIPFHINNVFELINTTNILFSTALFAEFAHHVWFLAFLFLYSLVFLPLFRFFQGKGNIFLQLLTSKMNHTLFLFILVVPLFLIMSILRPLDATYSGWPAFIYWGYFYIIGYIIFSNPETIKVIEKYWYLFFTVGSISFMLVLLYLVKFGTFLFDNPDYSFIFIIGHLLWSLTSYSWVFIFIVIGKKWLNFKSDLLFHITSISMPFYLIHLPVVLIVAYFTVMMQLNLYLKFGIIFLVSLITSIILIEGLIRKVKPVAFIFGMKYQK